MVILALLFLFFIFFGEARVRSKKNYRGSIAQNKKVVKTSDHIPLDLMFYWIKWLFIFKSEITILVYNFLDLIENNF